MTEQQLATWAEQFQADLAETEAILRACEQRLVRITARLEAVWTR